MIKRSLMLFTLLFGLSGQSKDIDPFAMVEAGQTEALIKLSADVLRSAKSPAGENLLMRAASLEKESMALALLKTGAFDVNALDHDGNSVLLSAVSTRLVKLTAAVLEAGGRTDLKYDTDQENILFEAVRVGDAEVFGMLLRKNPALVKERNFKNESPLQEAVKNGHYKLALRLVGPHQDPSAKDPVVKMRILQRLQKSRSAEALQLKAALEASKP